MSPQCVQTGKPWWWPTKPVGAEGAFSSVVAATRAPQLTQNVAPASNANEQYGHVAKLDLKR
jgi:hypothetical protein